VFIKYASSKIKIKIINGMTGSIAVLKIIIKTQIRYDMVKIIRNPQDHTSATFAILPNLKIKGSNFIKT
jgi:hypothetical protein